MGKNSLMSLSRHLVIVGASVVALAGCGSNNATNSVSGAASTPNTAAQQAKKATDQQATKAAKKLSPAAQKLLQSAQNLAGDVATTGKQYTAGKLPRKQAQSRLNAYRPRADALAKRARALPQNDAARARLTRLTDQVNRTIKSLRADVNGGSNTAKSSLEQLRRTANDTYKQLESQLPADTRRRVDKALKALDGG